MTAPEPAGDAATDGGAATDVGAAGPTAVFIGPMGAGKTRLGRRVAKLLGVPFADTDKIVVAEHGPIAGIFDAHGEPHFRALERAAVARALTGEGVVALGGGAVLDPATQADLATLPVVLLVTTPEAVAARLGDGKRPLVRGGVADWERILADRLPLYSQLANWTVDTSTAPFETVAARIADLVRTK